MNLLPVFACTAPLVPCLVVWLLAVGRKYWQQRQRILGLIGFLGGLAMIYEVFWVSWIDWFFVPGERAPHQIFNAIMTLTVAACMVICVTFTFKAAKYVWQFAEITAITFAFVAMEYDVAYHLHPALGAYNVILVELATIVLAYMSYRLYKKWRGTTALPSDSSGMDFI